MPPVPQRSGGKPASSPFRAREALRTWAGGDTHQSHGPSRRVRGPRQARLEKQAGRDGGKSPGRGGKRRGRERAGEERKPGQPERTGRPPLGPSGLEPAGSSPGAGRALGSGRTWPALDAGVGTRGSAGAKYFENLG